MTQLSNKNIVICISGGIAAYKSLSLIRLFKTAGNRVRVIATKNALEFVTRLSIETLSQERLYIDEFEALQNPEVQHISLAEWADVVIIAPATANIIGKFANGIGDDTLSTFLIANQKTVFVAPAMNVNMFSNPIVQKNISILVSNGVNFIEPTIGFLACGTEAKGRMAEPEQIFEYVAHYFDSSLPLKGKKALVTAGPTYEPIDPVRFIGNYSSGLMGYSLAEELAEQGAIVSLVSGPTHLIAQNPHIKVISVTTAQQMCDACLAIAPEQDLFIMAAAVADYTPIQVANQKIKKNDPSLCLELTKTTDILKTIGLSKNDNQLLVGFALETENELQNAKLKLQNKKADIIVLNSTQNKGAGFKTATNLVTLLTKEGEIIEGKLKSKKEVAKDIISLIINKLKSTH